MSLKTNEETNDGSALALGPGPFEGDRGTLPVETRRVLVALLLGPAVDADRQTKLWPILLRDEEILRSRLHDLFLELIIDQDQRVAFTRQVATHELDVPVLLRKASLTLLQSALLLFLREQLIQAETRGERAVVSTDEMLERLAAYEPNGTRDHAKFQKQAAATIERAKELSLLRRLRATEERFEVSPTLKLVLRAEEILQLTHAYQRLRDGGPGASEEVEPESEEPGGAEP